MSQIIRKQIPLILTFLTGVILIVQWFIPTDLGKAIGDNLMDYGIIISSFAVMTGVLGLYINETKKVVARKGDWQYSIWMVIVVSTFILLGVPYGYNNSNYQWLYNSVLLPLNASMYGVISFYIAAAAYRVLKLRSIIAIVMLVPAMILILANTPMITPLWSGFSDLGAWIMKYNTDPVYTGIMIGVSLGTLAAGIRTLIGLEIGWLGRKEEGE
jgi:hypothetical protein